MEPTDEAGYEFLTQDDKLQVGDEYWYRASNQWFVQRGHEGLPPLTSYVWRRKLPTPAESIHFL